MSGNCFGAGDSWWGEYTPYATDHDWWRVVRSELLRNALDGGPVVRSLSRAGVDEGGIAETLVGLDGRLVSSEETRDAREDVYVWPQAAATLRRAEGEVQLNFVTTDEELFGYVRLLGRLLDIRIVATTNAKRVELDEALLRPGRLSARIATDVLATEHAVRIYRRLRGKDAQPTWCGTPPLSLARVYATAYEHGWRPAALPGL